MGTMKKPSVALISGAAAAVVVAAVVAGTMWASGAEAARSQVEVLIGSRALACKNPADVTVYEQTVGTGDTIIYPVPALNLNNGLDCTFTFIVNNTGDTDVSLTGLRIIGVGSANANGAGMPRLTHNLIERTNDGSADANFNLNQIVAAGEATQISAVVERSPGCLGVGGGMMAVGTPTLTLSAHGLTGTVSAQGPAFALRGTADSACGQ